MCSEAPARDTRQDAVPRDAVDLPLDLGSGFHVRRANVGTWHLTAPFAPAGWTARVPSSPGHAAFPGTALRLGETWLEVVQTDIEAGSGGVTYTLAPWPDAEVFRSTADLSRAACSALVKDHHQRVHRQRRARLLTMLAPVVGLLPGDDQTRLETRYGITATRVTALSAIVILPLAAIAAGVGFAASRGLYFGMWQPLARQLAPWWVIFVYLALESVIRLRVATSADLPCGSAPIAIPVTIARTVVGALASRSSSAPIVRPAPAGDPAWRRARDTVTRRPDGRIEIRSRLPKAHWTLRITGIAYNGLVYAMIERDVIDTPAGRRYRFVLEPLPPDRSPSSHVNYHPDEVRDLLREQQRIKTAMWIESVPFLWGLQGDHLQRDLERVYRYDPLHWTRFTIASAGLVGVFNLVAPWQRATNGLLDLLVVTTGVLLIWETLLRARDFRRGALRPSILGRPFTGIARRALRWAPRRDSLVDELAKADRAEPDRAKRGPNDSTWMVE